MSYKPMVDFWHGHPLASEIDNDNKELIRVDLGIDPKTKKRLYDFHERRVQLGTAVSRLSSFNVWRRAARAYSHRQAARWCQGRSPPVWGEQMPLHSKTQGERMRLPRVHIY